jgi:cellulose synthase (UDP-forming)
MHTTAFAEPLSSEATTTLEASAARRGVAGAQQVSVAEPALEEPPLVAAPNDDELYWYLGRQQRWVQVVSVISFALAASSLVKFSLTSPWLYPLLIVLAITVGGSFLSMISGLNQRRFSKASHVDLTDSWERSTPTAVVPSVDVFLPSCGEDMAVLRNTFTHVARMQWRGTLTIWVLDDADKREVEELAADFGFEYRVRPDRGHMKKAGNLRAGYGQSNGDFIVIFDADFCPRADFLSHTIPYMDDPEVAIVQTPQFFDTKESMNWLERTAGATQELFYRFVQPSRDRANAPICVGTCAVYRRAALQKAGGFAQIEHSEDVHTGIKLTTAGYVVRYVPIVVSRGLCPSDLAGFLNQQYRWCNGSMTLLASGQASRKPLSVRQRISFWSGFMYYISTALNVFFLHVPGVLMAVFFAAEVRASNYIPFLAGMWMYFVVMPRISKSRWRYEVLRTQMAYSFCHALAIVHKLTGRTAGWVATGAVSKSSSLARSISMVGIVTLSSTLLLSWGALFRDVAEYGWAEFWTMGLFLAAYSYLAVPLLASFIQVRSGRMPRRRADVVVPAPLPANA